MSWAAKKCDRKKEKKYNNTNQRKSLFGGHSLPLTSKEIGRHNHASKNSSFQEDCWRQESPHHQDWNQESNKEDFRPEDPAPEQCWKLQEEVLLRLQRRPLFLQEDLQEGWGDQEGRCEERQEDSWRSGKCGK